MPLSHSLKSNEFRRNPVLSYLPITLETAMLPLLKSIFGASSRERAGQHDAALEAAIETAVDGTDPRIRGVSGYRKILRPAVARALEYAEDLVEQVPGPVELTRSAFASDPFVHACFGSAEQLQTVLSRSRAVREYLAQPGNAVLDRCYAAMGMTRSEKTMLGSKLVGDIVRRDVRQVALNFSEHRLVAPAATVDETRKELKERAYARLVEVTLADILSMRTSQAELQQHRSLLHAKLQACRSAAVGLQPFAGDDAVQVPDAALEDELRRIDLELQEANPQCEILDDCIEHVVQVLGNPEPHLSLERFTTRVNRMGIKVEGPSPQLSDEISFVEAEARDLFRAVVTLVVFPVDELRSARDPGAEMARFLNTKI